MSKGKHSSTLLKATTDDAPKGSINSRINILYFLDSLCESSLLAKAHPGPNTSNSSYYVDYVARDLATIVTNVVPEGRAGLPNLMSTRQVRACLTSSL